MFPISNRFSIGFSIDLYNDTRANPAVPHTLPIKCFVQCSFGVAPLAIVPMLTRGQIRESTISLSFLGIITLRIQYTMFTLQTSFKPLKGEEEVKSVRSDCE